jgi:hypothetical protein
MGIFLKLLFAQHYLNVMDQAFPGSVRQATAGPAETFSQRSPATERASS